MPRLSSFPERVASAVLDWRDGMPVSRTFGDVYFSADGGVAETTHVFLDGNDLHARFSAGGFRIFTIGETGFGTGLNFLVAAQAFLTRAPADARLHFVSCEKFPISPHDLSRAHAHWPELAALSAELRAALPPGVAGFHRRSLCQGRIHLSLLQGDAALLLPRLSAQVNAWFLDGFAPAKNNALWTSALFAELARLSAPGATFATFSAAGEVKRRLSAAGFVVQKATGFGRKRHMLRGRFPGHEQQTTAISTPRSAAVIGGGLAGCAAARSLAERGWQVTLIERHAQLASETSGNLAGAVYPKFSLHETPQNRWYRDSYLFALARLPQLLGEPDGSTWQRCGLLQLPGDDNAAQLAAIAASGRWPEDVLHYVDSRAAGAHTGIVLREGGLWFPGAAWVNPPQLCRALVTHPGISMRMSTTARELAHDRSSPTIDGEAFDIVVIANALAANEFPQTRSLPLRRVRGQVSHVVATETSRALRAVICHAGYITPARHADNNTALHCVGATFGPRDSDPAVRDNDHAENLANLAATCPALYAALGGDACTVASGRTGFRTQTPDYLPVIGAVADVQTCVTDAEKCTAAPASATAHTIPDLYILAALGAKGIAFSLLGAEIIAAQANGEPLPVDTEVAAAIAPNRFMIRAARRQSALRKPA
ncbi:MAG: bifunctional tRNA (5-methylaminomethyl-2-thiouridine)(34)-methyltransferase MnmD/FAD-dependent 5-carboxymethylaminomethyl-2-thiouridine(34) oxidoreductase MnmC [Pseudomonadota bacterium]